ncbi:hypothetical protein CEQ21_22245 [Niallia circulans]|uniref:Uncharacterized protein n=1 Tax=Niallia circulans TaxID=1397 RepID=A0A553SMB2_NIACI|nr:hypothetical protein [Niallia circulans]TRZ38133.1 hypothetical protein CEQ21_22245 [Niallia circulans]
MKKHRTASLLATITIFLVFTVPAHADDGESAETYMPIIEKQVNEFDENEEVAIYKAKKGNETKPTKRLVMINGINVRELQLQKQP